MKKNKEEMEKKAFVEKALKKLLEQKGKSTTIKPEKKPPRNTKLFDCLSRITITDVCPKQYLDVILSYEDEIGAKLVHKVA